MAKICYLLEINTIHSRRWIEYFAAKGFEILVLSDSAPNPPLSPEIKVIKPEMNLLTKAIAFKVFPKPYGNETFKWIPYKKYVKEFKPDIIHAMEARAFGFTLSMMPNSAKKILTPWGNDVFYDPYQSKWCNFLVKNGLNSADIITTNNPAIGKYLHEAFGIDENKVDGFSWGIDLNLFNPFKREESDKIRKELNIPAGAPVIVSNRNFAPYWGAEYIIDAIPGIVKECPEAHVVFLCTGCKQDFLQLMKEKIIAGGCEKNVRYIEHKITREDMALILNMSDIFISAAFTDMLAISVLEGMACGAVPVVSDLEAFRTRIKDGENGFLIPVKNSDKIKEKVIHILKNHGIRKKISHKNWEIVKENDDWEKCCVKMLNIYEKLLKK